MLLNDMFPLCTYYTHNKCVSNTIFLKTCDPHSSIIKYWRSGLEASNLHWIRRLFCRITTKIEIGLAYLSSISEFYLVRQQCLHKVNSFNYLNCFKYQVIPLLCVIEKISRCLFNTYNNLSWEDLSISLLKTGPCSKNH